MFQSIQQTVVPGIGLSVRIEPWGPTAEEIRDHTKQLLQHSSVADILRGKAFRPLDTRLLFDDSKDSGSTREPTSFLHYVYNYTDQETLVIEGDLQSQTPVSVRATSYQPLPTAEEFNEAVRVLVSKDEHVKAALLTGQLTVQRPMPPLSDQKQRNGRSTRIINVGLLSLDDQAPYKIVGVDLASSTVEQSPEEFLSRTVAPWQQGQAALQRARAATPPRDLSELLIPIIQPAGVGQHWFTLSDQSGQTVWRFLAVRPANSSGLNGSGLEIRYADYKGKRVLYLGHLPVLNVLYDPPDNTEFRDWATSEAGFDAVGTDLAPGFRMCSAPPTTVFETGTDGSFFGVAAYQQGSTLTLSTMMQAGWYRYYMAWSFSADGRIQPRVGFTTNGFNPHQGVRHKHHAYLRLDLDIDTPGNNLIAEDYSRIVFRPFPQPPIIQHIHETYSFETEVFRTGLVLGPRWTVSNTTTGDAFQLTPGGSDGSALGDSFGVSDVWTLHYRATEIDDGVARLTHPAHIQIDKFVNHESIDRQDVVLWYGVHFVHDPAVEHGEKNLGPDLYPVHW
jgi:Copper amine oxidase, enzyme domain